MLTIYVAWCMRRLIMGLHPCIEPHTMVTLTSSVLVREFGVDVGVRNYAAKTPLHYAASEGHADTIRCLVKELGADVDATSNNGKTPLRDAAWDGHDHPMRALVIDVGAKCYENAFTPLHTAASSGHSEAALLLLNCADAGAVDDRGDTPLHVAVFNGNDDGHTAADCISDEEHGVFAGIFYT